MPTRRWSLRAVAPSDREFLIRVYASTREQELAATGWSDEEKRAFVRQQFDAQDRYYRQVYPNAQFDVILAGAEPAGRLYVNRSPGEMRIIDIALLPAFRNGGLGSDILAVLLAEAATRAIPVSIHVEHDNPALRLYRRLGFEPVGEHGLYLLMIRRAGTPEHAPEVS